jgi:hypothetical protein
LHEGKPRACRSAGADALPIPDKYLANRAVLGNQTSLMPEATGDAKKVEMPGWDIYDSRP